MSLEHTPQRQRRQRVRLKPLLIPIRDAFDMIGVGVTKGYELVNDDVIETVMIGSRRYATSESLERIATPPENDATPAEAPEDEPGVAEESTLARLGDG